MKKPRQPPPSVMAGPLALLGLLACGLTAAGFAGSLWWPFELASHFRVQYLVMLATAAFLLLLMRRARWAGMFAIFATVNLATIAPLYVGERAMIDNDAPIYRAMLVNVKTENVNFAFVRAAIEEADPDFVVLEEVNERWLAELESLERSHPHSITRARSDNFGIALYSKHKLKKPEIVHVGPAGLPSIVAEVRDGKNRFKIVATHPMPPVGGRRAALRDGQLDSLATLARNEEGPLVVIGDLNVSPWSPKFRDLLEAGSLADASRGHGVQGTWPAGTGLLAIPIDQCLVSADIAVVDEQVGPNVDSDHYPLIVDFQVSMAGTR